MATNAADIACAECGRQFATVESYQQHQRDKHFQTGLVREIFCSLCKRRFANDKSLIAHLNAKHSAQAIPAPFVNDNPGSSGELSPEPAIVDELPKRAAEQLKRHADDDHEPNKRRALEPPPQEGPDAAQERLDRLVLAVTNLTRRVDAVVATIQTMVSQPPLQPNEGGVPSLIALLEEARALEARLLYSPLETDRTRYAVGFDFDFDQ